jgi:hypothetical protein
MATAVSHADRSAVHQATSASAVSEIVTSTLQLPNNAGTVTTWIASDGFTSVQTLMIASGTVVEQLKVTTTSRGAETVVEHRAVFPTEHEWASFMNLSVCESACDSSYSTNSSYLTPASIRALLSSHKLRVIGTPTRIDGVVAEEVTAASIGSSPGAPASVLWIKPRSDEIVKLVLGTGMNLETDYRWHQGTAGNLAHLELTIPRGFTHIADTFAEGGIVSTAPPPAHVDYQTALDECAGESAPGLSGGPTTSFSQLRAGSDRGMPWALWYGGVIEGQPVYALLGGSGARAQCLSTAGGLIGISGAVAVSQLPGRAVAFAIGLVDPASITSVKVEVESSLTATPVPLYPLAGTSYDYAFAEISGLSCKNLSTGGLSSWVLFFSGAKLESTSSGGSFKTSPPCTA